MIIIASPVFDDGGPQGTIQLSATNNDIYEAIFPGTAQDPIAGWRANQSGAAESATGNTSAPLTWVTTFTTPDWLVTLDDADADFFELEATQVSQTGGGTLIGTLGSFQALTATRSYSIQRTSAANGTSEWVLDIEIREILDILNTVTGRLTLRATREPL